jgi:3-deoxy-D-manno-octulosonate 8-phosphate phosphatase (KDO 8-P phosphatase)
MTNKLNVNDDILDRARKIKLLLMDCDGVLTDGRLYYFASGEDLKVFNVKDGQGIVSWHKAGFESGIITKKKSDAVKKRATELGVSYVKQNSRDKMQCFSDILADAQVSVQEVAYVGDDLSDIELLKIVGFSIAVADAAGEVLEIVDYVTKTKGGFGAVREITDLLLECKKNNS